LKSFAAVGVSKKEEEDEEEELEARRPVEILVHNLSHSDAVLSLAAAMSAAAASAATSTVVNDEDGNDLLMLARPKFFSFEPVTRSVLDWVLRGGASSSLAGDNHGSDIRSDGGATDGDTKGSTNDGGRGFFLSSALFPVLRRDARIPGHPLIRNSSSSTPSVLHSPALSSSSSSSSFSSSGNKNSSSSSSSSDDGSAPPSPFISRGFSYASGMLVVPRDTDKGGSGSCGGSSFLPVGFGLSVPCQVEGRGGILDVAEAIQGDSGEVVESSDGKGIGGAATKTVAALQQILSFRKNDPARLAAQAAAAAGGGGGGGVDSKSSLGITGVYFPLLASVLPKWLDTLSATHRHDASAAAAAAFNGSTAASDSFFAPPQDETPAVKKVSGDCPISEC
jgi:hypothetical protein